MRILHCVVATFVAMQVSCSDHVFDPIEKGTGNEPTGRIEGRTCDPSGRSWLASAMAYTNVVRDGVLEETRVAYSDRDGFWLLEDLPLGNQLRPRQEVTDTSWPGVTLRPATHVCIAVDLTLPTEAIERRTAAAWRTTDAGRYAKRPAIFILEAYRAPAPCESSM